MITINLLPWREAQREIQLRHFLYGLLIGLTSIGLLTIIFQHLLTVDIVNQMARNAYIQTQINYYEGDIKQLNSIKSKKERYLEKVMALKKLQLNQIVPVYLFETIVNVVPSGLYVVSIEKTPDHVNLTGVAQSTQQIDSLISNIHNCHWLQTPQLTSSTTIADQDTFTRRFVITSKWVMPTRLPPSQVRE